METTLTVVEGMQFDRVLPSWERCLYACAEGS
jgi:hypothetical protein